MEFEIKDKKLILSHPTSNEFNRAAASGLLEADLLAEFHTTVASFTGTVLDKLGAIGPLAEIRRRRFSSNLRPVMHTWPWAELGRNLANKVGLNSLTKHESGLFSVDAVYRSLDKRVASKLERSSKLGVNAIYAYEDGALLSFQESKRLNMQCLYELPIGYWRAARKLMEKERLLKPEWASTLTGIFDSNAKLARKDEELQLADRIFVASQFTANTLKEYPGTLAPIEVIPYGFPKAINKCEYLINPGNRPLKILFVGGLSQRKGIAELFAAVDALGNHITLTVVGRKASNDCSALDNALAKHRWIPSLPHVEVLKLMQEHDLLVFPSLFEGFGLVITEAMSQGTPVITTERTAGPDLIEHGENGWIIEAGSTMALQAAIENLIIHPKLIAEAGKAALETARSRPWEVYGRELAEAVLKTY